MKSIALFSCAVLGINLAGCQTIPSTSSSFRLSSPDVKNNQTLTVNQVANTFGCHGNNQPPKLSWANAPGTTKSFAVSMYDPDAPTGSGFWHWLVVNIPKTKNTFDSHIGLAVTNDAGSIGYLGACPPEGQQHRYQITVYALDVENLPVDAKSTNAVARFMLNQHVIAKTTITGLYAR